MLYSIIKHYTMHGDMNTGRRERKMLFLRMIN